VVVSEPFYSKLNKIPSTEERALERATYATSEGSRLACCVQIRPELNEMICVVAANRSSDGEWFGGDQPGAF